MKLFFYVVCYVFYNLSINCIVIGIDLWNIFEFGYSLSILFVFVGGDVSLEYVFNEYCLKGFGGLVLF